MPEITCDAAAAGGKVFFAIPRQFFKCAFPFFAFQSIVSGIFSFFFCTFWFSETKCFPFTGGSGEYSPLMLFPKYLTFLLNVDAVTVNAYRPKSKIGGKSNLQEENSIIRKELVKSKPDL